jgi:hypothetical protein
MDFSKSVRDQLVQFESGVPSFVAPAAHRWGGTWYCPVDGSHMAQVEGAVRCRRCRCVMSGRLLYELIEFHVHP